MFSNSTLRVAPLAEQYGHICRWLWLALPEDAQQEVSIVLWQYPSLTARAREAVIRYRFAKLRHEAWDRRPTRVPLIPHGIRPSKLAKCSGYRTDSAAHRTARLTVNPEQRRAIARKGQTAWRDANFSRAS
jgi:hypothetical protein